jgi:predicted transcriptional regulator
MSGRDLQHLQSKLGIGPEAVCAEAGISMSTLYKIYNGVHVRESSKAKVVNAFERLRMRLQPKSGSQEDNHT